MEEEDRNVIRCHLGLFGACRFPHLCACGQPTIDELLFVYDAEMLVAVSRHREVMGLAGKKPSISESCFIAPSANIVGEVSVGPKSSVWYGAILIGRFLHHASLPSSFSYLLSCVQGMRISSFCNHCKVGGREVAPFITQMPQVLACYDPCSYGRVEPSSASRRVRVCSSASRILPCVCQKQAMQCCITFSPSKGINLLSP